VIFSFQEGRRNLLAGIAAVLVNLMILGLAPLLLRPDRTPPEEVAPPVRLSLPGPMETMGREEPADDGAASSAPAESETVEAPSAAASAEPEPDPLPNPEPAPEPEPVSEMETPEPEPQPQIQPKPEPEPLPDPVPEIPTPEPEPEPLSEPVSEVPAPEPEPEPPVLEEIQPTEPEPVREVPKPEPAPEPRETAAPPTPSSVPETAPDAPVAKVEADAADSATETRSKASGDSAPSSGGETADSGAAAENREQSGPYNLGEVDIAPKATRSVQPEYPFMARRRGIEGVVRVRFRVDREGRVGDLEILEARPSGVFEKVVRQAVSRWRFAPGRKDGVAVETWVEVPVRFELD
jgi:protein TonB